jgi:peptidyl-prolyl cis-trans isomerase SurA
VEIAMPEKNLKRRSFRLWLAVAIVAAALAVPASGHAQVVVVANGSPITELDIQQRSKLIITSTPNHKAPSRQEVINDLIDDRLKIAKAKTYSFEVAEEEVDAAFENMAKRQRITPRPPSKRASARS